MSPLASWVNAMGQAATTGDPSLITRLAPLRHERMGR
jgi:hypothetical protein